MNQEMTVTVPISFPRETLEQRVKGTNRICGAMGWIAYIWLVTSETWEELYQLTIGKLLSRIMFTNETSEEAQRAEPQVLLH